MKKYYRILIIISIIIGAILPFITGCQKDKEDYTGLTGTVTDFDGNIYQTTGIGTQIWMAGNLKTTRFNDGTPIPLVTDSAAWENLVTPGYCYYNNDVAKYKNIYGGLYNWYAVNTGKLASLGWHIPTKADWKKLMNYLGGENNITQGKLKEKGMTHWLTTDSKVTNESGFTALPGGDRCEGYLGLGTISYFWSSTLDNQDSNDSNDAYEVMLYYEDMNDSNW